MDRKHFFKNLGIAGLALTGLKVLDACSNDDSQTATTTGTGDCVVSPTETAGPFPTHTPSSLVRQDITEDRTGIPLDVNIRINNINADCAPLADVIVDIWHCDKDGNYSEYGGTQMQQTNYSNVSFLRGRQVTNSEGKVAFGSIFPGWYSGRATHIHVHVYTSSGSSLLVTQIAFPEGSNSAVVQVNAATEYGYTKGMSGYTYNANDNIFNDDTTGSEIATVSGSNEEGYVLDHTINVSA